MFPKKYFLDNKFIIADSAIKPRDTVVPQFKGNVGQPDLPNDLAEFNSMNLQLCVRVEHSIWIWKGRFPFLRNIRMRLTEKPSSLLQIHCFIHVSVILHNLMIGWGDNEVFWDKRKKEQDLEKDNYELDLMHCPDILEGVSGDWQEQLCRYLVQRDAYNKLNWNQTARRTERRFFMQMNKMMSK